MKTRILAAFVAGLVILTGIPQAGAGEKLISGKERTALKAEDVKRRLNEAETFIKVHQDAATSKAPQE